MTFLLKKIGRFLKLSYNSSKIAILYDISTQSPPKNSCPNIFFNLHLIFFCSELTLQLKINRFPCMLILEVPCIRNVEITMQMQKAFKKGRWSAQKRTSSVLKGTV